MRNNQEISGFKPYPSSLPFAKLKLQKQCGIVYLKLIIDFSSTRLDPPAGSFVSPCASSSPGRGKAVPDTGTRNLGIASWVPSGQQRRAALASHCKG